MKSTVRSLFLVLSATAMSASAVEWFGLDEASHYSGPKITAADLEGKVVMVDEWGVNCPPCRALLPRMEEIWQSFKTKPFVLIGSHRQGRQDEKVKALVNEHKLTYPIYGRAGLAEGEPDNGGGIPFIYVVNPRGKVVYSGRSEREATEAAVEAITRAQVGPDLLNGVTLVKFKNLKKQLVFGKNITSPVKTLEKAVEKAKGKTATPLQKAQAEEAERVLEAINASREEFREEIASKKKSNPAAALKLIRQFQATWPKEGVEYKADVAELTAAVAAEKAAAKPQK